MLESFLNIVYETFMVLDSFIVGNAFFNPHFDAYPLVTVWGSKSIDWLCQLFAHVNHSRQIYGNYLNSSAVRNKSKNPDVLGFGYSEIDCNLQHSYLQVPYCWYCVMPLGCCWTLIATRMPTAHGKCSQLFCMFAEGKKTHNATYFLQAPMWDSRILYSNALANANDALSLMS